MATLGEREKTYKFIYYPLNVRNFLCRAAELQCYRAWTVSERTADGFSHCSLFYWYTIRQIIGQSTCLSTAFMPCVLNRTNLASVQIIVPKYHHVPLVTHFAFHPNYFPPQMITCAEGKQGGRSILWSTCQQTWQWTLKVIYSADGSWGRLMFIFHPSMVFIIH